MFIFHLSNVNIQKEQFHEHANIIRNEYNRRLIGSTCLISVDILINVNVQFDFNFEFLEFYITRQQTSFSFMMYDSNHCGKTQRKRKLHFFRNLENSKMYTFKHCLEKLCFLFSIAIFCYFTITPNCHFGDICCCKQ